MTLRRSDDLDPYCRAALEHAVERMGAAAEGGRNVTLNAEAFGLAKIRRDGRGIDRELAEGALIAAAVAAGVGEHEARATFASGWRGGLRMAAEAGDQTATQRLKQRTTPPEWVPPVRLPRAEVLALWSTCGRPEDDDEVSTWLSSRKLDPAECSCRGLVRALPGDSLPPWAMMGPRTWAATKHRAILPLIGPTGEIESLRARSVVGGKAKAVSPPNPAEIRGLVLADQRARALLAGEAWAVTGALKHGITIREGEPDFLESATFRPYADETAPAIFGVIAGAWSTEIAARIPTGTRVRVRTHADLPGFKYADEIAETLQHRCAVLMAPRGMK